MKKNQSDRILVVDDESCVREVLHRFLTEEGYGCEVAEDVAEAVKRLESGSFSLLVADIMMPRESGLQLLHKVRKRFPDLAVIMVTGVDDRSTAILALELGAYGYIAKPVTRNEVVINVVNALERRRLTLERQTYERRLEAEVRERTTDVRQREEEIALRLVWASEYRDEETGTHIRRVGLFAQELAAALAWDPQAVDDIRVAAPMHDIGKIGVPDSILLKPGKLTEEEFGAMKKHTEIGAGILDGSDVGLVQMAKDIALYHHEKWDGSGYPRGLRRKDIPRSARLAAVADVYDSLVHDRVYRPAMPEEKALAIMREGRSQHFEPQVFDCFLEVLPELRRICSEVSEKAAA